MNWLRRDRQPKFLDVGWPIPGDHKRVFSDIRVDGSTMRLLDKSVHQRALEEADETLEKLLHRVGPRAPA